MNAKEEYLQGIRLALLGKLDEAIAAFKRSLEIDPDALEPALNLLEAYLDTGRLEDAENLGSRLLAGWSNQQSVLMAVAKLREAQGRPEEALDLIRDPNVDLSVESLAFPTYLRLLLVNSQYEQALLEATRAQQSPLWQPQALLAKGVALSHLEEHEEALRQFETLDAQGYGIGDPLRSGLIIEWVRALKRAGAMDQAKRLLTGALNENPDHTVLARLRTEIYD